MGCVRHRDRNVRPDLPAHRQAARQRHVQSAELQSPHRWQHRGQQSHPAAQVGVSDREAGVRATRW